MLTLLLPLAGLALLDSTSVGTLVIPGLLLARSTPPYRALPWYAGTLFLFYLLIGLLGLGGLDLIGAASELRTTDLGLWVQLIVGAALVLWGVLTKDPDPEKSLTRWRSRLDRPLTRRGAAGLGLTAGVIELAGMLPYLAALGMLTAAQLPAAAKMSLLAGYCLVMFLPALLLTGLRLSLGRGFTARLQRFTEWMMRQAEHTLLWVAAIVGVLLIREPIAELFLR
ncbi:GAP family protein [Rothia kristinae]|uniref:GAP family protein n=1 Tax=Rothia kristinae TaxID=37923 RepID=A0A7T3CGZ0_9MICC|nr:GAP family protein [Rothia kristinae]KTR35002.1 hypothetical protein RSA5_09575 [Rothia kristinae]KTR58822.1 hypothetical protein SA11R_04120 [Rothia kristinae]KTR65376.1 hypothetical protein SA15R_09795 [Rothia kristinae]KTR72860.1 hypothetical protein SA12R_01605 [Rothia kristinae]KTR74667.1 hypothetical protein SA14R_09315 [Rothia kristinae]